MNKSYKHTAVVINASKIVEIVYMSTIVILLHQQTYKQSKPLTQFICCSKQNYSKSNKYNCCCYDKRHTKDGLLYAQFVFS